jgi:hypothetical protein
MPIALAPEEKSLRVFPARAEKGDDAVGQLAQGHGVEGRGVEPIDDERAVAADPFEAFGPPSKWWTPLISSCGSRKVFDGYIASSIHG